MATRVRHSLARHKPCSEAGSRETPKMLLLLCLHTILIPGIAGLSHHLQEVTRERRSLVGQADGPELGHHLRIARDTGVAANITNSSSSPPVVDGSHQTCNRGSYYECVCQAECQRSSSSLLCCTELFASNLHQGVVVTLVNFTMDRYASGEFEEKLKEALAASLTDVCKLGDGKACEGPSDQTSPTFRKENFRVYLLNETNTRQFSIGILVFYPGTEIPVNVTVVEMKWFKQRDHIESALNVTILSIGDASTVDILELNITGLVFAGIFGVLFLMTCVISARKACVDRKAIKARIEAKRVIREKQQKEKSGEEDNKRLVIDYEEVHGGNTILPKAVSVKINGIAKGSNGKPAENTNAKTARHVAVQATVHEEIETNGITTGQVHIQGDLIPNGKLISASTICTQTNASSKESLLNNINKEKNIKRNSHADVIVHSADEREVDPHTSRRKNFAKSNSVPDAAPGVPSPRDITHPKGSGPDQGTGHLQLPPDANGSIPHGLPDKSSAEIERMKKEGVPVVNNNMADEESFLDTTMSTPKNSEPDIYATAHESPIKLKAQQLGQGYENPAYAKGMSSPD